MTRRTILTTIAGLLSAAAVRARPGRRPFQVWTFGDSILDCARYNPFGVHPGALLVQNDDARFPEFAGQDLSSSMPARLQHRAVDGATVDDLPRQLAGPRPGGPGVALLTIGGNDLLQGLLEDDGRGLAAFQAKLRTFLDELRVRPVLIGTVYDPTFGDDANDFLGVDPVRARRNHHRMNELLAHEASRVGRTVDLHAHFLRGDPSWFVNTIEPSLRGASEVRRCFLPFVLDVARAARG